MTSQCVRDSSPFQKNVRAEELATEAVEFFAPYPYLRAYRKLISQAN